MEPTHHEHLTVAPLEGISAMPSRFAAEHVTAPFAYEPLLRVLLGQQAVCHMHGLFDGDTCAKLRDNFWNNPGLRRRADQVPGHYVGAYHYAKSTSEYLEDCKSTRSHVDALFVGTKSPLDTLRALLSEAATKTGRTLRRASHGGIEAGLCGATAWSAGGQYMLAPHDDVAQVAAKAQRGFEIQDVTKHAVLGINLYVSMPKRGGELELWNICPNEASRVALGLVDRGHPYPLSSLRTYDSQVLRVEAGDCVVLNGAFVHGVRGVDASPSTSERRLILTLFAGIKDEHTVLWWT